MRLAPRTKQIGVSPTMKVAAEAMRLKAQGVDIVDLGAGEPDFPTPAVAADAGRRAIDEHFTKYTTNSGTDDLKRAVAHRYRQDYGVEYSPSEVIITAGGKQALFNAVFALFGPGDEVITHAPGWPTLVEQIKLADARPVVVRAHEEDGFQLRADTFLAAFTPSTRGVIINSPSNPTGALMPEEELAALAEEAAHRDVWVLLDLCYERLIYDPVPHNLPAVLGRQLRNRSVLCGSSSKSYAMTGWRCGWALAPAELIGACNALQSHTTSNASSISQKAAEAVLRGPQDAVTTMLDEYRRRRDQLVEWLSADPRLAIQKPAGAFYLFPDISELLSPDGIRTSAQFAQALLDEARVAVTPGEAFDAPGFLRLSYATSMEQLQKGATRLLEFARKVAVGHAVKS